MHSYYKGNMKRKRPGWGAFFLFGLGKLKIAFFGEGVCEGIHADDHSNDWAEDV